MRGRLALLVIGCLAIDSLLVACAWIDARQRIVGFEPAGIDASRTAVIFCAGVGEFDGMDATTVARLKRGGLEYGHHFERAITVGCHWKRNLNRPALMRDKLIEFGAATERVLYDTWSYDTRTNLLALADIQKESCFDELLLISSTLHLRRILDELQLKAGEEFRVADAETQCTAAVRVRTYETGWLRFFYDAHHEWVARATTKILPAATFAHIMCRMRLGDTGCKRVREMRAQSGSSSGI